MSALRVLNERGHRQRPQNEEELVVYLRADAQDAAGGARRLETGLCVETTDMRSVSRRHVHRTTN